MNGLLLPGNATPADVANGKTFSGGAGIEVAGTYTPPVGLIQAVMSGSTTSTTTLTFTPVSSASNFVLSFANPVYTGTLSATAGTWSELVAYSPTNGSILYIYRCNALTAGTAVTLTITWANSGYTGDVTLLEFAPFAAFGSPVTNCTTTAGAPLAIGTASSTQLQFIVFGTNATTGWYGVTPGPWSVITATSLQTGIAFQFLSGSSSPTLSATNSISYLAAALLGA